MNKDIKIIEADEQKTVQAEETESSQINLAKGKKLVGYAAVVQIGYLLLSMVYFLITTSKFSIKNTVVLAIVIVLYMLIFLKGIKLHVSLLES